MKVIIAGSRHMPLELFHLIDKGMQKSGFKPTQIICGMARGADMLGAAWATYNRIEVAEFPAEWNKYGKSAGPIRNGHMAKAADAAIVFIWDNSRGSANMIKQMENLGKPCFVVRNGVLE
jgi:hypothetical protein